jgi:hypothetical protein
MESQEAVLETVLRLFLSYTGKSKRAYSLSGLRLSFTSEYIIMPWNSYPKTETNA